MSLEENNNEHWREPTDAGRIVDPAIAEEEAYVIKDSMDTYIESKDARKEYMGQLAALNSMTQSEIEEQNRDRNRGGHKWAKDNAKKQIIESRKEADEALKEAQDLLQEPNKM